MRVPVAIARQDDLHLVVPRCPYCGEEHRHSRRDDYGIRAAHCWRGAYELVAPAMSRAS